MKNYYDELEVNKNASKEVIEKVYKILAKKYHPDTTKELDKQAAEEKFKAISEAYEFLSDDEKRKKYDLELEQSNPTISYEEYINIVNQRDYLNNTLNKLKNELYQFKNSNNTNNQQYYRNNNQYNQVNSKYNNTNTTYNISNNYKNTTPNNRKFFSIIHYLKCKIKAFILNILLLLFSLIMAILIINAFSNFNLFNLL